MVTNEVKRAEKMAVFFMKMHGMTFDQAITHMQSWAPHLHKAYVDMRNSEVENK